METNTFIADSERTNIIRLLYRLKHCHHVGISNDEMRQLGHFIGERWKEGVPSRDCFGFNRAEVALEAATMAAEEINLSDSVLKALLADVAIADERHVDEAEKLFGKEISDFLKAFERVRQLTEKTEAMQSDNFRNLLVVQAGDMRIVLALIVRCVIMMRRVKGTENTGGQQDLANEAARLYAPLAHKLGLYKLKSELEDLSLKYLEHDAYYMIKENLNATKKSRDAYVERFIAPIREMLDAEGYKYHMKGRTKSIHSIWQKMKKQKCGFNGVFDLFAIRIILDAPLAKEKEQCWKVFSLITNQYESDLRRFRDWLTMPKSNGYESLHITVRGPEGKWVEVQIRTERMDEVAERGLAAHWRYKGVKSAGGDIDKWLTDIRSALENEDEALLARSLASKPQKEYIYIFTPKGNLHRLPVGATVLDFAYHIHSTIGNHCVGGIVNGRNVPMRTVLESGATVEVTTANNQTPKADWVNIVVSSHARAKIRQALKELQARDGVFAKELLERKLRNRKLEWDETVINQLIKKMGYKESSDFYRAIAEEKIDLNNLLKLYVEISKREAGTAARTAARSAEEFDFEKELNKRSASECDVLVIDRNLKDVDFQMARCCNPVYGDDVFGFVTVSGGIKIHRTTCPNAPALRNRFGYRIVKARWAGKGSGSYPITLHVVGQDDLGIVNNITSIISKEEHIMLRSINIESNEGLFYGTLTIMVNDTSGLNTLIKKLRTVRGVKAVSR